MGDQKFNDTDHRRMTFPDAADFLMDIREQCPADKPNLPAVT